MQLHGECLFSQSSTSGAHKFCADVNDSAHIIRTSRLLMHSCNHGFVSCFVLHVSYSHLDNAMLELSPTFVVVILSAQLEYTLHSKRYAIDSYDIMRFQ